MWYMLFSHTWGWGVYTLVHRPEEDIRYSAAVTVQLFSRDRISLDLELVLGGRARG